MQGERSGEFGAGLKVIFCSKKDADTIFQEARDLNMTGARYLHIYISTYLESIYAGAGYAWIVTEQALHSRHVPHGALGLHLTSSTHEEAHIHDSL